VKKVEQPKIEKKIEIANTKTWNVPQTTIKIDLPKEKKVEEKKEIISEDFEIVSYKKIQKDNSKKHHTLCRNISKYGYCKYEETCIFAHNINELSIDICRHGNRCTRYMNGQDCQFLHTNESMIMYVQRRNINF
jgi:hypothetical protein